MYDSTKWIDQPLYDQPSTGRGDETFNFACGVILDAKGAEVAMYCVAPTWDPRVVLFSFNFKWKSNKRAKVKRHNATAELFWDEDSIDIKDDRKPRSTGKSIEKKHRASPYKPLVLDLVDFVLDHNEPLRAHLGPKRPVIN